MRRLLSLSLLLLFTLPLVSPLFTASAVDANVPVCCRRDGKHHCMMAKLAQRSASDTGQAHTVSIQETCPYNLFTVIAINLPFVSDEVQTAVSADTVSIRTNLPQTEAPFSLSPDRSHQKRGPPSPILSRS
ncbi:hypothetical protein P8936_05770 [Edaphobacter paludis]|uniref:DUF2946 domain-containing protein n=1 Tax=Edaphobacter paludis TaxID=3035702 RepID=A0AAU7DCW7_9BACT